MNAKPSYSDKIRKLLQSNTVMSLKQLRLELDNRPRSSLFRDLQKLDLVTSYTHAGQYHALKSVARFDDQGLWFFEHSGFTKYGTLKNALIQTISNAQVGMTQNELKNMFRSKVQNALTYLVKLDKVGRQSLPDHVYIYLNVDRHKAEEQLQKRLVIHNIVPKVTLPAESLIIEILLEFIRSPDCFVVEGELGRLLRKRGITIDDTTIVYVLTYYGIKKKTDFEVIKLIRRLINKLYLRMDICHLFAVMPQLTFQPASKQCDCGRELTVAKTSVKTIATLDIGEFRAIETQKTCKHCTRIYRSDELRTLTPHGGKFGFDVIVEIGMALFVRCRSVAEIQAELAIQNIPISSSEISYLGKRFIVYLLLAHQECQAELKQVMQSKGGYILHMDGTCEGGSPHLFSCMDEISNIVLGNRKMPTEDSQYIIPLLQDLKAAYGDPIAIVHDMGGAILKAVLTVFLGIPDFICHFHFLRDLGKDLFDIEYRAIRRITRSYNIRVKLYKTLKQLKAVICGSEALSESLDAYLKGKEISCPREVLDPSVVAYLVVAWVLESDSASNGFGFPFDQPHLEFYLRLKEAWPLLKQLKTEGISGLPLVTLSQILRDTSLAKMVSRIQEKISIFEELRKSMRIARPDNNQGLNDEGDEDIKTIKEQVIKFRYSTKVETLAKNDISYQKMVAQIDKYWEKLFADPIQVETPTGSITIQPQRTNNLLEQSFRFLKRDGRKKTGQHSLSKSLMAMLADTPLVRNLSNQDYMAALLKGKNDLASRFADIDIQEVRKQEKENEDECRKYPKRMARIFKIPHLPLKLMKMAA